MVPPDEQAVLRLALEAAKQEYQHLDWWLVSREKHPFDADVPTIHQSLRQLANKASGLIKDIERALRTRKLPDGWASYAELCDDVMPKLANELLAIIGGMYLMAQKLDPLSPRDRQPGTGHPVTGQQTADDVPVSFTKVARVLLENLAERAGRLRGSTILIVGEERRTAYETAWIIRLRFPACDIWNLPFTAHEYGYLVAQQKPPTAFDQLKDRVKQSVDPAYHRGGRPDNLHCYLPDIQTLWDAHYGPPGRDAVLRGSKEEILRLTQRQVTHLCRLFADAFATCFVGPAYVHALLNLRFRPDQTLFGSNSEMPSLVERFVYALETLRWMDEQKDLYEEVDASAEPITGKPFAKEVDPTGGTIPNQWWLALKGAQIQVGAATGMPRQWQDKLSEIAERDELDDNGVIAQIYDLVKDLHGPWLELVKGALGDPDLWDERVGPTAYQSWRQAQRMEQLLVTSQPEQLPDHLDELPHPWAVLNAAWSARVKEGETVRHLIERNAIWLLNSANADAFQGRGGGTPGGARPGRQPTGTESPEQGRPTHDADIGLVRQVLGAGRHITELTVFLDAVKAGSPPVPEEESLILKPLKGHEDAIDAYWRLFGG
jgi:hypothetical protein